MKRTGKELKRISRETLTGHYGIPMGVFLCKSVILLAIELPFSMLLNGHFSSLQIGLYLAARFLITLIGIVLSAGCSYFHLQMARKQKYELSMFFYVFKNQPDRYVSAGVIMLLTAFVCMIPAAAGLILISLAEVSAPTVSALIALCLLSLILVIRFLISVHPVYYLLLEHEEMDVESAYRAARKLMQGNRGRLFGICLSFLGMELLSLLSIGIGNLWVRPYEAQTFTNFYLDISGELPDSGTVFDRQV